MKYYYEPSNNSCTGAGEIYICNHPLYSRCTLFKSGEIGLAIVQEHYNKNTKARWWGPIESWLSYDIYVSTGFMDFFSKHAGVRDENGLYPTVPVRKIMWALRMKPLKKEFWEMEL